MGGAGECFGVRGISRSLIRWAVAVWAVGVAMGHVGFENSTEIRVQRDQMQIVVKVALNLTWKLLGDGAPQFDDEQAMAEMMPLLTAQAEGLLEVTDGGEVMLLREKEVASDAEGAVDFTLSYDRPLKWPVKVKANFFKVLGPLDSGTMSAFDETAGPVSDDAEPIAGRVIVTDDPALSFSLKAPGALPATAPAAEATAGLGRYFLLGIEHILSGYDHLLFLFALVVACRSVRAVLIIVTAFTVAHSITLALAALGTVKLPMLWVESFIALSIVCVGVENVFFKVELKRRAVLTLAFGLVHGLGFASALKDLGLGANGQSILGPLIVFNLGVETGQLTLVAIVLPILLKLRKRPGFEKYAVPVMSGIVIVMGSLWFLQRVSAG
jgi:hydrogenase/urease accessory protein HupE